MKPRLATLLALLVLPALAASQATGGSERIPRRGTAAPDYDRLISSNSAPTQLTTRDLEGISPVRHLLDKRKDMTLTEDQVTRLKVMDAALKEKNAPHYRDLDSLRREMKPSDAVPEVERIRLRGVRQGVAGVVKQVRDNYDASEAGVLGVLSDEQRTTATALLEKQRAESDEMLRKKLGGGRRGS